MEAIILAGGMGTRLKKLNLQIPKPMIHVAGKPFLEYLIRYLEAFNVDTVILSVGYKAEAVSGYFGDAYRGIKLKYSYEDVPLGTGGGIKKAMALSEQEMVLILNGDTFFDVNLHEMLQFHQSHQGDFTIAGKKLQHASRYGKIEFNDEYRIIQFKEKGFFKGGGIINGGIYLTDRNFFLEKSLPGIFSLEHEFFEKYVQEDRFLVFPDDGYFIDIGIPDDLKKAHNENRHLKKYE